MLCLSRNGYYTSHWVRLLEPCSQTKVHLPNQHNPSIYFIFQFYDFCTKWIEDVDENPSTYAEMEAFETSREMNETLQRVNQRLGFEGELMEIILTKLIVVRSFKHN